MTKPKVLIIDDERNTREGLQRALAKTCEVTLADNGRRGLELIHERGFDLVLTDLRMPEMDGLELLKRLGTMDRPPACIMLTAYGTIQTAIDAVRAGAETFLEKPIDLNKLELAMRQALESRQLKTENRELKRELASHYAFERIIGQSPAMSEILATVRQVASARTTVLITGENGTGKEVIARALHQLSDRANRPFVAIHCAALTPTLLESELFGHEKGAFTGATERRPGRFEAADGGTILLDEVSEIPLAIQVKLLRVLETRTFERVGGSEPVTVDIRLLVATNRDLKKMVADGTFREDLYYRLDVLNLRIPPLRERRADIPLLLMHYLQQYNQENHKHLEGFTPDAAKLLEAYAWPGNVRQLKNCVERIVVLCRADKITVKDLPQEIRDAVPGPAAPPSDPAKALDLTANEAVLIRRALDECHGNRTAAAVRLGISRRTLHRKLHEYHLA